MGWGARRHADCSFFCVTLAERPHLSEPLGDAMPRWGVRAWGGRAVGEQAHGHTCRLGRLAGRRLRSRLCRSSARPSWEAGGGGWRCGAALLACQTESESFHANPACDLGQLSYPAGPQYLHLENGGLEFMVTESLLVLLACLQVGCAEGMGAHPWLT